MRCYAIGAQPAFIYIRGEYATEAERARGGLAEAYDARATSAPAAWAPGSSRHLPSTAARAPTSAARRRRCSIVARGRRGAAARAAVPGRRRACTEPTVSTTSRRWPTCRPSSTMGGERYARSAHRANHGHADLLAVGPRAPARQLRAAGRRDVPRPDRRAAAAASPGGRTMKCFIPGGSSAPILTPDDLDVPLDYRDRRGGRRRCSGRAP